MERRKMNIDELLTEEEKKVIENWKEAQKYAKLAEKEIVFNDDYEKAAEYYTIAIELEPRNYLHYEGRSYCYGMLKRNDEELKDINKAIELNPREDRLYMKKSTHYLLICKHDNAIEEVNKAIEILYGNISFYYGWIMPQIYESKENYEKAIECCNKGLELSNFHYKTIQANKKRIEEKLNERK